ncbi:MAG: hypothetical protein WDO69_24420 [Pseudomonadota bacterium]
MTSTKASGPDVSQGEPGSAINRLPDGTEVIHIGEIIDAIDRLTEGRSKAHPELSILAFDVLQSIISGHRVEVFKDVYERTRVALRTMARRHVHFAAGRAVLGPDSTLLPAPADGAAANALRSALANEDARFRGLPDAELIDAIEAARVGNESSLSTICARLSLACGAFDDVQRPGEEVAAALDRVRLAYVNAGPRPKTKPSKKRKSKRKKR